MVIRYLANGLSRAKHTIKSDPPGASGAYAGLTETEHQDGTFTFDVRAWRLSS